jgi:uncharacterized protein (DUF2141 family)
MRKKILDLQLKIASAIFLCLTTSVFAGQLKIDFENVVPNKGVIHIAIFPESTAASFPVVKEGAAVTRMLIDSDKTPYSTTVFLPNGNYAISAFEDTNNDGVLALDGPNGSPSQPWGVSNNRKPSNRAPDFADAIFSVSDGDNTQKIRLGR